MYFSPGVSAAIAKAAEEKKVADRAQRWGSIATILGGTLGAIFGTTAAAQQPQGALYQQPAPANNTPWLLGGGVALIIIVILLIKK